MSRGSGQRGGLGGLPTPFVVSSAGGMRSTLLLLPPPFFLPAVQKWQLGVLFVFVFLVFLYLVVHNWAPTAHVHNYF